MPNFQLYQFPIPSAEATRSLRMDLRLHFCGRCHHAHIRPAPDDDTLGAFYASQYSAYTSPLESPGVTATINDPACEFIAAEINTRYKQRVRIVEVGGYDGYVLKRLADLAEDRLLIEGSRAGAAIARRHGIPVLPAFLDRKVAERLKGSFDIVISRHVIEHVREPAAFLRDLMTLLAPGGVLVVETPDLAAILDRVLVRTMSLQHLHLFSPRSLARLLRDVGGFRIRRAACPSDAAFIVAADDLEGLESLPMEGRRWRPVDDDDAITRNAATFGERLGRHNVRLTEIVRDWRRRGKRVWIWGAGTAAGELFSVYGQRVDDFVGYIDSDARKTAMRFSSAPDLPICTPGDAYRRGVDAVLIASFSVREIGDTVRRLGWAVEVVDLYSGERHSGGQR